MSASSWLSQHFEVEMPLMAPGEKLCEVEFLKWLAAYQWRASAASLGTPPRDVANERGERLYGSIIDFELDFGPGGGPDHLCEGTQVFLRNRVKFFAKRFAEGLFVFSDEKIPEYALDSITSRRALRECGLPWACMTNAFIARGEANTQLAVHAPAIANTAGVEEMSDTPQGITDHREVQATGALPDLGKGAGLRELPVRDQDPIRYAIIREADLNGASLVYFARYIAMANYAERNFLGSHLERPASTDLVGCLSTEHRRIFYFGNAPPSDTVEISVEAKLIPPEEFEKPDAARRWSTPWKLLLRHDLRRGSDKVLMASTVVRKSLNIPADRKAILREADRFLNQLG